MSCEGKGGQIGVTSKPYLRADKFEAIYILYLPKKFKAMIDSNPIDLPRLKQLIHDGVAAIPIDSVNNSAVLVIGDTGVGKSTIMSFLSGTELVIKYNGLKPTLDSNSTSKIKIGHEKYSETSIPTKVVIEDMAFYDCPGFKDNKGEEYEISNSFFIQRLLDIYKHVKLVLIIDESHISEARADKLPKLVRNLHKSFKTFEDIKDGVTLIINRAGKENTIEDYHKEIKKMLLLKNENGSLFNDEERNFLTFLMANRRVLLFKQALKQMQNKSFIATAGEQSILGTIKNCSFVKSRHIQNILSESAKLSIRDFIDQITSRSNYKIEIICGQIVNLYHNKAMALGSNMKGIISLKDEVIKLGEEIRATKNEQIVKVLQRELPKESIQDFEEDFASVLFFKNIYDKTSTYFSNLINKIYSELTSLLTKLDKRITTIQREQQENIQKEQQIQEQKIREDTREKEKVIALDHCEKMEELKVKGKQLLSSRQDIMARIKAAMMALGVVVEELRQVKSEVVTLRSHTKELQNECVRVETVTVRKQTIRQ